MAISLDFPSERLSKEKFFKGAFSSPPNLLSLHFCSCNYCYYLFLIIFLLLSPLLCLRSHSSGSYTFIFFLYYHSITFFSIIFGKIHVDCISSAILAISVRSFLILDLGSAQIWGFCTGFNFTELFFFFGLLILSLSLSLALFFWVGLFF